MRTFAAINGNIHEQNDRTLNNFIKRTLTGIVFAAVILGGICLHPMLFLGVFGLVTALSLWEFYGLMERYQQSKIQRAQGVLGGTYLFVATFAYANGWASADLFLPYLLYLMVTLVGELYYKAPNPINNWAFTLLGQLYGAGTFALLNLLAFHPTAEGEVQFTWIYPLSLFIFIWLNDTGAYLVGSQIGKRRLFERISPKKSWEGFWGGVVVVLAASQAFAWFAPEVGRANWLGLAFVVVLFGTWGDLVESLLKRTLGVKDSGNLLPGHGGMLDRFDSVMLAIPAAYIYIEFFIRN